MENENPVIEKVVLTLKTKSAATELKKEIINAGVPSDDLLVTANKDEKPTLTIDNANVNLHAVIKMFMSEPYNLSIEEVSKLLNISIE